MKAEDLLSLVLCEVFGVSAARVDEHFKEFRRAHRRSPLMIDALEREVVDPVGNPIADGDISQLVEKLKQTEADSPEEFWGSLARNLVWYLTGLINLFLQEVGTQLRFAAMCYENYLTEKNEADTEMTFFHIHHFLVHTANVDKLLCRLLDPPTGLIAELAHRTIDLNDIDLKSFRAARNHLEHFDERLDAWFYVYAGSPLLDMVLADAGTSGLPEERCLRVLRTDEDLLAILGESFDLGDLYRQVCLLAGRIEALGRDRAA